MDDTILALYASGTKEASSKATGLEAKLKAAMAAAIEGNWMAAGNEEVFRSALGGVLLDVGNDTEDGKRLISSIESMKRVSAFFAAAKAGLSVDASSLIREGEPEPLPLVGWWQQAVKAADETQQRILSR